MKLPGWMQAWLPVWRLDLSPTQIRLRDLRTQAEWSAVPEVAIGATAGGHNQILAVGADARAALAAHLAKGAGSTGEVVNPFSHPRSMFDDFVLTEQLFKFALRQFQGRSLFSAAPLIAVSLPPDPAGGYTQVEKRACSELVRGAGAREVHLCVVPLTDAQMLASVA